MVCISLLALIWLTSARKSILSSDSGLRIVCSMTGVSTTIPSSEYQSPLSDAEWIWTSRRPTENDYCNVTVYFLKHSPDSDVFVSFYTPDAGHLYVNGALCPSIDGTFSAAPCFSYIGYYELVFESLHTTGLSGMAFKVEEDYPCPDSCPDCMDKECCPLNFIIDGSHCTCQRSNSYSCQCPEEFDLIHTSYNPPSYSCVFSLETRDKIWKSEPGMSISCTYSGNNTAVSTAFSYITTDAYGIWTPANMDGDACSVAFTIIKQSSLGTMTLSQIAPNSSELLFLVNNKLCRTGEKNGNDVSDCFHDSGLYEVTFHQTQHPTNGMSFRLLETFHCPPKCNDCIDEKCCPTNYIYENNTCGCPQSSIALCSCPFGYQLNPSSSEGLANCQKIDTDDESTDEPADEPAASADESKDKPADISADEPADDTKKNAHFKEVIIRSRSGLNISCDDRSSIAVNSLTYINYNDITDSEWIWGDPAFVQGYMTCSVSLQFFRHPYSQIYLQFDGAGTQFFSVNNSPCGSYYTGSHNSSVTACFDSQGLHEIKFLSRPGWISDYRLYGMSFRLVESYFCPYGCSDCIGLHCCSENSVIQNNSCIESANALAITNIQP